MGERMRKTARKRERETCGRLKEKERDRGRRER